MSEMTPKDRAMEIAAEVSIVDPTCNYTEEELIDANVELIRDYYAEVERKAAALEQLEKWGEVYFGTKDCKIDVDWMQSDGQGTLIEAIEAAQEGEG